MAELDLEALAPERIRGLSRREYDELVRLGHFEDERVELLRGMLVTMSPQGGEHSAITAFLMQQLVLQGNNNWDVRAHSPYAASADSEPEPDVLVTRRDQSIVDHPSTSLLVIEVADSSIRKDRRVKTSIYAEANVPEYWIVDISKEELRVEIHTGPSSDGYRKVDVLRDGDVLRPTRLPGIEIAVIDIPWRR